MEYTGWGHYMVGQGGRQRSAHYFIDGKPLCYEILRDVVPIPGLYFQSQPKCLPCTRRVLRELESKYEG